MLLLPLYPTIKSYWRGAFARELAKEIRYRRQREEEEKKRKQPDEDSTDLMRQIISKPEKEEDHEAINERYSKSFYKCYGLKF